VFGLGQWEVVIIILAILLLFGGKKIPELMRGLGTGVREFKKGVRGVEDEDKDKDHSKKIENHNS
jgi:sec-independent protein translocase protein TatA